MIKIDDDRWRRRWWLDDYWNFSKEIYQHRPFRLFNSPCATESVEAAAQFHALNESLYDDVHHSQQQPHVRNRIVSPQRHKQKHTDSKVHHSSIKKCIIMTSKLHCETFSATKSLNCFTGYTVITGKHILRFSVPIGWKGQRWLTLLF